MTAPSQSKGTIAIVYNTALYVLKLRMRLIKVLRAEGYDIVVIAPRDEAVPLLEKEGIRYIELPMSQYGMNPLAEIKTVRALARILQKLKPVVSLHYTVKPNTFGNIAASMANVPVINNVAGAGRAFSSTGSPILRFIVQRLYRAGLRRATHVFFQNNEDRADFIAADLVAKEVTSRIPGSGVDVDKFLVQPLPEKTKFLFVGRLLKEKGIAEYVMAAAALKKRGLDCEVHIVGEHSDKSDHIDGAVLQKAVEAGDVIYHGSVLPDTIPALLKDASCVVLPSYYGEGVPKSLLEACATGRPVITTDHRGCRDAVNDGVSGFLVNPRDTQSLEEAMAKIIDMHRDKLIEMGAASRRHAETVFDERFVLDAYLDEINKIVD
ncbi:glycosyltransferase family 4 protein [Loktanella sp. F6476L]|uniref:glycosyltransferase family 4 protein n=1 Tax=Loktanella sp. F6476L TaxID=2926405 RepID=UPI001FF29ECE|nr:glycosyltransferase family 4 protein [Loktanella sp. F6476L]MCK0122422.1 glycosyltransferase family 4 protein [Loktanella sp. F6476L]